MGAAVRLTLIASVLAVACGGSHERPRDGGGSIDGGVASDAARPGDVGLRDAGPLTFDEFLARQQAARCREAVRCEERYGPSPLWVQTAYCLPQGASRYRRMLPDALEAGRIAFEADQAQLCLEVIEPEAWCAEFPRLGEDGPCRQVFSGAVPEGGDCTYESYPQSPVECIDGMVCVSDGTCPGTCLPVAGDGDTCVDSRQCSVGLACRDGVCQARSAPDGAPCEMDSQCQSGVCASGACAQLPIAGEPCDPGGPPCSGGFCVEQSVGEFRCVSFSDVGEGGPCIHWLMDSCRADLVCDFGSGVEGTCVRGEPIGGDCTDGPCAIGGRCVEGRCVRLAYPHAPCGPASVEEVVCPLTHHCLDGQCQPLPVVGEPCASDGRCARGACADGVCTLLEDGAFCYGTDTVPLGDCRGWCDPSFGSCRRRLREGEVCPRTGTCADGLVCDFLDACVPDCTVL